MIEVVAVIFSLICVYLISKENIWAWLVGMIGVTAYFILFLQKNLYAEMVLQVVFFTQSIYGWYNWKKDNSKLKVTEIPYFRFILNIVSIILISFGLGLILQSTNSNMPLLDSFTSVISLFANQMLTKKKLQAWILWIIVDCLFILLFIKNNMYLSVGLYSIFLLMAINGYNKWRKSLRMG